MKVVIEGDKRVLRGGSWINNGRNVRSANRNMNTPDNRNNNIGFRLAPAQTPKEAALDQVIILSAVTAAVTAGAVAKSKCPPAR